MEGETSTRERNRVDSRSSQRDLIPAGADPYTPLMLSLEGDREGRGDLNAAAELMLQSGV